MIKYTFNVSVSPLETFYVIKKNQTADLVHEEIHDLGGRKFVGTLVFEKHFMGLESKTAIIVTSDNLKEETEVRVILAGSSHGMLFNHDWGTANKFADSIKEILEDYIIHR